MCCLYPVDSGAMTDSVITDSCPPADINHMPTQPSCDDADGEVERDSHAAAAVTTDENLPVTAAKVNGYTTHDDTEDGVVENGKATDDAVSVGNIYGPKTVDGDAACAKLCSSDLRMDGCGGANRGNSSSAAALLQLTNGHVDL